MGLGWTVESGTDLQTEVKQINGTKLIDLTGRRVEDKKAKDGQNS